ncbi:hypothetical protein MHI24_19835 [Paenibacillus sp. FSL K6-1096]|uniref:hypothetical protein n=1 Tax=Paenibacillus sp. FSL K6-1096 TaxID=2921460 RepID=UPI0030EF229A
MALRHFKVSLKLLDQCIEMQMAQLIENCYAVEENGTFPSRASLLRALELVENNTFLHKIFLDSKGRSFLQKSSARHDEPENVGTNQRNSRKFR